MINPTISEWLNLIARWVHVFAGIMWVGTTYYFTWLDARMTEEEKALREYRKDRADLDGAQRRLLCGRKTQSSRRALTQAALVQMGSRHDLAERLRAAGRQYYLGGGALVDRDVSNISVGAAVGVGIGTLVLGWLIYDLLVISPLGRNEVLFAMIAYVLIVATAFGLTRVLSGRARLHPHGRDVRHDHGGERLDAYPAGATKDDRSASKPGTSLTRSLPPRQSCVQSRTPSSPCRWSF